MEDFLAWYLWVIVFIIMYTIHKIWKKSEITPLRRLDYYSFIGAREEEEPEKGNVIREIFEFERPRSKVKPNKPVRRTTTVSGRSSF